MTPVLVPLADEVGNPARHANRLKKEKASLSKRLEALEDQIAEREDEKAQASAALLDAGVHANPDRMRQLATELAEAEQALAELMERWEGLSGEIESLDEALESIG
jgi:chromosome segregation ATPase